ncbi:hypothetical protein ACFL0Q_07875, partial [Thermodesulfobacteriota bacterium]
ASRCAWESTITVLSSERSLEAFHQLVHVHRVGRFGLLLKAISARIGAKQTSPLCLFGTVLRVCLQGAAGRAAPVEEEASPEA